MGPRNTHDKTNEELEGASLPLGYEDSFIPKNECDDEVNERLCEKIAVQLDLGVSLYNLRQSSSLVRAATVKIGPAASQAKWAEPSWTCLLV
jgi:hypothetical protein